MPQLRDLDCTMIRSGFTASGPLESVEHATLDGNDDYPDIFTAAPNLQSLRIDPPWSKPPFPAGLYLPDGVLRIKSGSTSLGNLDELRGLEHVSLRHFPDDIALDPLANCLELRLLDLRESGITDLSPLAGHPELRYIAVNGSSLDISLVPDDLEPLLSYAKKPDLAKARNRKRPKAKKKRATQAAKSGVTSDAAWPNIERDLAGSNMSQVLDGLEAAIALGPEAVEVLLSKASIRNNRIRLAAPFSLPFDVHPIELIASLLSHAAPDSEHAERLRQADRLIIEGQWKTLGPAIDLRQLGQFSRLTQLVVRKTKAINLDTSGLALTSLVVSADGTIQLGPLPDTLRRLMIGRSTPVSDSSILASQLQELAFVGHLFEPSTGQYASMPSLTVLRNHPQYVGETTTWLGDPANLEFAPVDLPGPDCKGITDKSWDKN